MSHSYFLSSDNPIATVEQRDLEATALHLLQRPELQKARTMAAILWRNVMAHPAREQMSRFDGMIDEYVFHYALRAANSDALNPKILRIMAPPSHWFGRDVPGSRWGGDSPDFIYRMIPLAHGSRYEIHGHSTCAQPPSTTYSMMTSNASPATLSLLDNADMRVAADGKFVITIDDSPAQGRANHLQTQPGLEHLLVRDALGDWLTQSPHALRVYLLDKSNSPPLTDEEMAQRAARYLIDALYYAFYCTQSGSGQALNELRVPVSSASFGGMPTQWGTKGNLQLEDDEALVVNANAAGALFRDTVLCDQFFMSLNYWSRTGSYNNAQMAADDDGRFTYVVAHQDPGVHNWLDTGGLRRTVFGHRWQAFPRGHVGETPTISARVVKFKDLMHELPAGVRLIDAVGRREQLMRREAGFKRRFIDGLK